MIHYMHFINYFPKYGILTIKMRGICYADKKLTPSGIRVCRSSHGQNSPFMGNIIKLCIHRPSRSTMAIIFPIIISRINITSLYHKSRKNSVEFCFIIKTTICKFFEIFTVIRSNIREKFEFHSSSTGFHNDNIIIRYRFWNKVFCSFFNDINFMGE